MLQFPHLVDKGNDVSINSIYLRRLLRGHEKGFKANSAGHMTNNKYQPLPTEKLWKILRKVKMHLQGILPDLHTYCLIFCWNKLLVELKSSTPPRLGPAFQCHGAQTVVIAVPSAFSWITASSPPSSPRTCAWSSTPGTPRSHRHARSLLWQWLFKVTRLVSFGNVARVGGPHTNEQSQGSQPIKPFGSWHLE